uniref:Multidrug and toxic compound extrusion protein n=1 Tax=Kalanchoe fedtschenkoi TaxID=63787 RepID=A0A7N0TBQ7_KALFE
MRAGIWCTQIQHAGHVPPTINHPAHPHRHPHHPNLRLLQTHTPSTWRASKHCIRRRPLCLRPHPSSLRLRLQLPHPKVPPSAEHRRSWRIHFPRHLLLHLLLSWLAIYKLGLGLLGASLILSLSWWIVVIAQMVYIVKSERCKLTWVGLTTQAFSGLPGFFRLSAASAVMFCLEAWYFQILVLLAGLLPHPELALDSLSICMTISGWIFMISVGFNAAASVRVSNELGAGNHKSAKFSVIMVNLASFTLSVIAAIVFMGLRNVISYAFTDGEAVAQAVAELCPFLAVTIILNGVQPVLSGVAVGCGWQTFVAYVNVICYYAFGIPVGALLGFYFNLGAKGIWSGMIAGTLMQTLILLWTTFRTDWKKEVEQAARRLNRWDDQKQPLLS